MNWGNKLLLVFAVFAGGMFFLVYKSMHTNYELVTKEYYKDELSYQAVIDGTRSANSLSTKVAIIQENEMITVRLPEEMKKAKVSGNIWFYCASDAKKDRHIPIEMNAEAVQYIDKKIFLPGRYTVKFDWISNNKHYYSEEMFTIL
jgi:hypothetical protein